MSNTSKPTNTILIAFLLPDDKGDWTEVEADDIADGFRDIINDEWERNAASRPGYYTPCEISAIPAPQWVTAESLRDLRSAGDHLMQCLAVEQDTPLATTKYMLSVLPHPESGDSGGS